jgi:hypothetical protein
MAKCNVLGRGEAHYRKKLDKAKEKITKAKVSTRCEVFYLKYLFGSNYWPLRISSN